ncbi:RAD55 family ATPase [Cereibacter changlensis]|nr:ATPase domain-containing protein [Cereibacter changlensis]
MSTGAQDRIATGIDGFDAVLGGGLVPGCAYILQGPPGAGKTVLANQLCFNLARDGRKTLYLSLLAESHDRMLDHMSTMGFFDSEAVPRSIYYMSAYSTLVEERLDGLLRMIHREMRQHKASLLVLDGLFVAQDTAEDDKQFRSFIHDLQGLAALAQCTLLILTNQDRPPGSPEHTMVDGWIELLDEMHGARSVRSLILKKQRGGKHLRGRHHFRITDDGISIFPRLEAALTREPEGHETDLRVSSGIAGLDRMIGGGYPGGSSTVVAGPSGTGKTTIGLQFLSQATPEEPGLLFGFYETPARLRSKARSIGIDIDGLLASGALEILWQSPAETLPDELGRKLLRAVERRNVKRVFFDGIGALRHAFLYPERMPLFIGAINNTLRASDTTALYSFELPSLFMPDQIMTEELSSMIENVILAHYVRPREDSEPGRRPRIMNRELLVLKIRDSEFDAYPEVFHITGKGVLFGGAESQNLRPDAADGGESA